MRNDQSAVGGRAGAIRRALIVATLAGGIAGAACSASETTPTTTGASPTATPAASSTLAASSTVAPAPSGAAGASNVTVETKNPLKDQVAAAAAGKPHYAAKCAGCHGDTGQGDGPAAAALTPPPTNLTKGDAAADPDGEFFLAVKNGKGKMAPIKGLTDEQIWQVVAYVRSLK